MTTLSESAKVDRLLAGFLAVLGIVTLALALQQRHRATETLADPKRRAFR